MFKSLFHCITKMSAFTTHCIVERLETEMEQQKAENAYLKERLVGMTKQMTHNRITNKKVLNQRTSEITKMKNEDITLLSGMINDRDDEIAELKKQLDAANNALDGFKSNWECAKQYTDDVISQRNSEITQLKKELSEQVEYTNSAIAQASEVENYLYMKNAQLQSQIDVISEMSERQTSTIYDMEMKLQQAQNEINSQNTKFLATEGELFATKSHLDQANQMLNAITTASSYITNVLSHRS